MADVDELERALLERWDPDTLAVYGDCLQARGDPRGELIALDRELRERGPSPALATRRRQRLYEWLGGSTLGARPWHEASFRDGFVTDFVVASDRSADAAAYLRTLFASPAGPFVRGLTIRAQALAEVAAVFGVLASARRPWLERLELRVVDRGAVVRDALVAGVIAATPRLRTLAVFGARAIGSFAHAAVRTLATDWQQLDLLRGLPAVEVVELSLESDDDDDLELGDVRELLASRPPRVLDLACNEPHYPPSMLFPFARTLAGLPLAMLRLPSVRAAPQVEHVEQLLAARPRLVVEIARAYRLFEAVTAQLAHPRVRMPAVYPWPPGDTLSAREALTIVISNREHGEDVSLTSLVDILEAQFARFPPAARDAWHAFWALLDRLPWEDRLGNAVTRAFPAATLLAALDPLDDIDPITGVLGHWAQLADKLRSAELPPDAVVAVRRYWGW